VARVKIVHTTEYSYRNPVGLQRHRLMVRPDDSHDLRLHSAALKVEPEPVAVHWKHDVFNNSVCFLDWPETLRTERLSIVSTLDLTHHPDGQPLPHYGLDPGAEMFPFSYAQSEIPDLARLAERQMPDPDRKVDAWARRVVAEAGSTDTLRVLEAIMHTIRHEFRYGARFEEGTQTAAQTIGLGAGTCRDFSVLMMEALRSYGIATRFVTGYLYDDTSGAMRGGGSTHAWCDVYIPGAGWVEYDPTNGLVAGANLIRVGVTREAAQAIPISGSFIGGPDDPAGMHVDVTVGAMPIS
jgi:transglutaminase-like putative cysteine protease